MLFHIGMREEGTENLLGNEGREITSGEEQLDEVSGVGVVIQVTADAQPPDGQRVGNEDLVDEGWQLEK
jgi:hypothetical protein